MHLLRASAPLVRSCTPTTHGWVRSLNRQSTWLGPLQLGSLRSQARNKHVSSQSNQREPIKDTAQKPYPTYFQKDPEPKKYPTYFQKDSEQTSVPYQAQSQKDSPLASSPYPAQSSEHPTQEQGPPLETNVHEEIYEIPRVRYIRPGIIALGLSVWIFGYLACMEAGKIERPNQAGPKLPERAVSFVEKFQQPQYPSPIQVINRAWEQYDGVTKLTIGIIAVNGAVHATSFILPKMWESMSHTPALSRCNITLLTSNFVHFGALHLFMNMYVAWNFMSMTGRSPLFRGDPHHLLAFFLSAGVLSSYGQHLSTVFSNPAKAIAAGRVPAVLVRSAGASGALFGIFGAFCMEYPNAGVGLMFIPFSVKASTMLGATMAFDLYGMVVGIPSLRLGHAAHLSGALFGVGYSYFKGRENVWEPMVGFYREVWRKFDASGQ